MKSLFERIRLGPRLALAFGLVLFVTLASSAVGVWRIDRLQDIADDLGGDSTERALLARELHGIVSISSSRAETLLQVDDPALVKGIDADRKITSARSEVVRKRLDALADDAPSRQRLAAIDATGEAFRKARNALVKRKEGGEKLRHDEVDSVLRPVADAYALAVDDFAGQQKQRVEEARAAARRSEHDAIVILVGGSFLATLLAAGCAWALARSIIDPLARAAHRAERVAAGDLSTPEVVDLQRDELQSMLAGLSRMQRHLAGLICSVQTVSESIGHASSEIAVGNLDLSSRTEDAASRLEETASSMAQLTATVRQSATSAQEARRLSMAASEVAARGSEGMVGLVSTMAEIATVSTRIADITGVIDGLAFQTNLLALNAAVEAARAGEQGRGFAVVASEVRGLAQRSATAAREIRELVGGSVEKTASGTRRVQEAGATMTEIVSSVRRVADIVGEISSSATAQSDGIGHVNTAVGALERMTQQNAALVEQSSAATEGLKQQADRLASVVGAFRLAA